MKKYYALKVKGRMEFNCVDEILSEHKKKVETLYWNKRGLSTKGSDPSREEILASYIPVIVTIEHQTGSNPNEAVTK